MSGICSKHQGHDKNCPLCTATPLSAEEEAYYRGWDDALAAQKRNCWTAVENCVLNVYSELEYSVRKLVYEGAYTSKLEKTLKDIDKLRELNRGMWARDLKQ